MASKWQETWALFVRIKPDRFFGNGNSFSLRVVRCKFCAKLAASNTFLTVPKSAFCGVDEVYDMQDFRNIDTWKKAHGLTLRVFEETKSLPRDETFGITMLLRRSATSIASQIAESCRRGDKVEAAADLRKAAASCGELEYLVLSDQGPGIVVAHIER